MTLKELMELFSQYDENLIVVHEGYDDYGENINYAEIDDFDVVGKYLVMFGVSAEYMQHDEKKIEEYLSVK